MEQYFKITNAEENHNGFKYVDGFNVIEEEFNDDSNQSCGTGGLYFTNAQNIFKFLDYGIYLRDVFIPRNDPDFKMVKVTSGDKYRANMIVLGKRYDLDSVETFEYLITCGADIRANKYAILRFSAIRGNLDVVKYIVEEYSADIHVDNDAVLFYSASNGHLDVVKYLVKSGADVHVNNNSALWASVRYGHFGVVKYLVEEGGADIHADNDYIFLESVTSGHYNIVKYLIEKGADANVCNNYTLEQQIALKNAHIVELLVKELIKNDAEISLKIKQWYHKRRSTRKIEKKENRYSI